MSLIVGDTLKQIKDILIYSIIFFMPFMSVINVFNLTKFNLSLADIFLPFILIYTLINIKDIDFKYILRYIILFVLLFIDILISNILAMNNNIIISGGISSLISEEIKMVICAIYFLFVLTHIKNKKLFLNSIRVWLISCTFVCFIGLIALLMYYNGKPLEINTLVSGAKSVNVFIGTFTDQNLSAVYLSISFHVALFYLKVSKTKYEKVLAYISLILCPICIFLTASRGGMIGFCCSIVFYMIISLKYFYKKLIIIIPSTILIFMIGMSIDINFMDMNISTNLFNKMEQVVTASGEFRVRGNLAKAAFKMGNDNFLLGVGRGNYPLNSSKYFEDMGLGNENPEYKDKIPHNTILGIYSELGIIGLILYIFVFLYLLYLILKNLKYKDYIEYQLIIVSMYLCIFIESIPLNLENFRGLWILTAIFTLLEQNILEYIEPLNKKEFKLNYKYIFTSCTIFLISLTFYIDNARKFYIEETVIVKDIEIIQINNFVKQKEQYIKYYINTKSETADNILTTASVVGIDINKNKKILAQYDYPKARGDAKLYFTPDENIQFIFFVVENKLENIDCTIKDIYIGMDRVEKKVLNEYPLLTDKMYNSFLNNNIIVTNTEIIPKAELWDRELNYNFGNKVILKSVKNKIVDGGYEIEFEFECINNINKDYNMWLHGIPDNINYLEQDRIQYGFDNFDNQMEIPMSTWKIGESYIHKYTIPIKKGVYELHFGFLAKQEYLTVDSENGLYFGKIDTEKH